MISILPLIFLPLEQRHGLPAATYQVQSSTVIAGTPEEIWSQLAEVDTIQPGEYPSGLFHFLGVPRPIRATVDRAEVGGHRTGEFEYGLRFDERITVYDAPETMSFSIAVDPRTLRENSSERHAFEGHYFRFEDATYHLVLVDDTHLRLELSSRYTVKSGANWYAQLWADAVFGDFQDRVLAMLKGRIEKGTRMASSP